MGTLDSCETLFSPVRKLLQVGGRRNSVEQKTRYRRTTVALERMPVGSVESSRFTDCDR